MNGDDQIRFCAAMADVLEVDAIGLDDEFRAVPDWCSLKAFGLLVTLENDWRTPLTIERFQALRTIRDLFEEVSASSLGGRISVKCAQRQGLSPT